VTLGCAWEYGLNLLSNRLLPHSVIPQLQLTNQERIQLQCAGLGDTMQGLVQRPEPSFQGLVCWLLEDGVEP
jgi:hypothetical protein